MPQVPQVHGHLIHPHHQLLHAPPPHPPKPHLPPQPSLTPAAAEVPSTVATADAATAAAAASSALMGLSVVSASQSVCSSVAAAADHRPLTQAAVIASSSSASSTLPLQQSSSSLSSSAAIPTSTLVQPLQTSNCTQLTTVDVKHLGKFGSPPSLSNFSHFQRILRTNLRRWHKMIQMAVNPTCWLSLPPMVGGGTS